MRSHLTTTLAVIGAATVLAAGVDTFSYAAGGPTVILGQQNNEKTKTSFARSQPGPVLGLFAKKQSSPPFVTNATGKVKNLNADRLDGFEAADLRTSTIAYQIRKPVASRTLTAVIPTPKPGTYLVTYSVQYTGGSGRSSCSIVSNDGAGVPDVDYGTSQSSEDGPGLNGVALVPVVAKTTLSLLCASEASFHTDSTFPAQLTLTPTSAVVGTIMSN